MAESTLTEDFHIDHQTKLRVGKVTAEVAYKCKYDPKAEKLTGEALRKLGASPIGLDEGRVPHRCALARMGVR